MAAHARIGSLRPGDLSVDGFLVPVCRFARAYRCRQLAEGFESYSVFYRYDPVGGSHSEREAASTAVANLPFCSPTR